MNNIKDKIKLNSLYGMSVTNTIRLNKYLRRNYYIDIKDGEIIIKNKIYVYELYKIREYVAKGKIKGVYNIRIEG